MTHKRWILVNVFSASFTATLLQRGAYFFTHDVYGFSQAQNLLLALLVGVTYIAGATSSHKLAARFGEKRALLATMCTLSAAHLVLTCFSGTLIFVVTFACVTMLQGVMWPLFESYMSAGETPRSLGKALSKYNISWALSVPASLAVSGALIASGSPRMLFVLATGMYALIAAFCGGFPTHPAHLAEGHADRPDAATLEKYKALLTSARYAMLGSYTLLYVLAPLMPTIMKGVGFGTAAATRAASLLDVARLGCFVALFAYSGWHGRKVPLYLAIGALPLGFALVLFGPTVATVVPGEILFGAGAGFLYTAALYYAQVVQNASVDAGGAHEALIGLGYAFGPSAGLVGTFLAHGDGPGTNAYVRGMSIATLPLIAACSLGALWPLVRRRRAQGGEA